MPGAGEQKLSDQLGGPPPPVIAALPEDSLHDLAAAVEEARHRQAAELVAAGEKAFSFVPRLLRGPVRRVVR